MASVRSPLMVQFIAHLLFLPYSVCVTPDGWIWNIERTAIKGENVTLTWGFGLAAGETFLNAVISHKDTGASVAAIAPGSNTKEIHRPNTDILVTGQNVTLLLSNVSLSDEDSYRCLIKTTIDSLSGQSKDTKLIVNVRPTIQTYPQSTIVVENSTVSLFCNATGKPVPVVTWTQVNKPGRSFPPSGTLTISRANANDTGDYNCTASNSAGSAMASATVTVKLFTTPSFVSRPQDQPVIKGNSIDLFCNASGFPAPSISWRKAGNSTVISMDNTLTLSQTSTKDEGLYVCTAVNLKGSVSTNASIDVHFAPKIYQTPQSMTVNESDTKFLFCNASGNPPPVITWTKEGDTNFRRNGETLSLNDIAKDDRGTYICTASNGIGQNATANATITVQYAPRDTTINSNATNNIVERPFGVKFTCAADAAPSPYLFQLYSDNNILGESADGIFELSSTQLPFLSTIRCIPHNIYWRGQEAELNLTVYASPAIIISPVSAVYNETVDVTLFCNATGNPPPSITWAKRDVPRFKHTGEILTLTDVWKNNTGTYICSASNGIGNNATKNATIVVQYTPYATELRSNATNDTVARPRVIALHCTTDSNPPPLSYKFYKDNVILGSSADGIYVISSDALPYRSTIRCVPSNLLGAGDKAEMDVIVHVGPVMLNYPKNQTVNETDSISMFCNASGNPPPQIAWKKEPGFTFHGNELELKDVTKDNRGTYICTASNGIGEDVSASATITVNYKPMGTVMHSNASNNIAVSPVAVVCNCSADANPLPIKYQFYSNDNLLGESFDGIYVISETRQYHGGIIKCVPRNMLGNGKEAFLNFTVNVSPAFVHFPQNKTVNETNSITLFCNASGNPLPVIKWTKQGDPSFQESGEILTIRDARKNHTGLYTCTASNGIGRTATTSASVTVQYKARGTTLRANVSNNVAVHPDKVVFECETDASPPASSYSFYNSGQLLNTQNDGIFVIANIQPSHQGTFSCIPTNRLGSGEKAELNLTVHFTPVIISMPSNRTVFETNFESLFCNASGEPPPEITWTKVGNSRFKHIGKTLTLANIEKNDSGVYICEARNGIRGYATATATILILYKPRDTTVTANTTNSEVIAGDAVAIKCTVDALPPAKFYEFSHAGILSRNSSSYELVITNSRPSDGGTYTCTPYNDLGAGQTAYLILNVLVPPVISTPPSNLTLNEGGNVQLYCNATGNPSPNITWFKAGSNQAVGHGETFNVTSVNRSFTGLYQCQADNGVRNASVATAFVNVHYKSEISYVTLNSETWIGKLVTITCEAEGNPRPSITWSRGGAGITTDLSSTKVRSVLSITPQTEADFGVYTCRAANRVGPTEKNSSLIQQTTPTSPKIVLADRQKEKMTVQWDAPSHDGRHAIMSYFVTLNDGSGKKKTCETPGNSTSCVIDDVSSSATEFTVTVKAKNGAGYGENATDTFTDRPITIRFPGEPCDVRTITEGTPEYKQTTAGFLKEIKRVYESKATKLYGANVKELKCGSITAIFGLVFSQNDTNYLEPLKEATKSGKLGTFAVDKDSVGDYKEPVEEDGFMKFWDSLPLGAKIGLIVALALVLVLVVFMCVMCIIKCRRQSHSGNLETASAMKVYSNKAYDADTENGVVVTKEKELHYAELADFCTFGKTAKPSPSERKRSSYAETTHFQKSSSQVEHAQPKPEPETGKEVVEEKAAEAKTEKTADNESGHVDLAVVNGDLQNIEYKPMPRAQMPHDDFMY